MDPHADPHDEREGPAAVETPRRATADAAGHELRSRPGWVPVRSLTSRHRGRILSHLLALDEHDRYLRFGFAASDDQIQQYADNLDFERDELFGIFNRRLELIAMAHLAYAPTSAATTVAAAEFGVSVWHRSRGHGLGTRLFAHAVLHARNRGVHTLFIQALSENTAMLKIARNAGAKVVREGPESEAHLDLPPESLGTQVGALVEDQAAEWDYRLKAQVQRVHLVIDALADAKHNIASAMRSVDD